MPTQSHARLICNINEHNKMNSVISRIHLVPRARSVLFDDGKVNCSLYLSRIYKQTIAWKWTGSLKILQYQYPYLDPYVKQLKRSLRSCAHLILQNRKIGEKSWRIVIRQSFFPSKVFYCMVHRKVKLYLRKLKIIRKITYVPL